MQPSLRKNKEQVETRNYEIRPKLIVKFTREKVYDTIKNILDKHLDGMKEKYNPENAPKINRDICDEIRETLSSDQQNFKRYKIMVHCIIGEKKGQGIRIASKCMWDTTCDCAVWASWENEYTYAFCAAYGVYYY